MNVRSRIPAILMVAVLLVSTVGFAAPVAAGPDEDEDEESGQAVQTLTDGEDLYLVFGAQLDEDESLEEYVEAHAGEEAGAQSIDQDADSEVLQYQDVDQVNLNVQGEAVAIGLEGGEAVAVQEASQTNYNAQEGEAVAENEYVEYEETQFENVGNVYFIFGDGDPQEFTGYAVAGDDGSPSEVTQYAEATVGQDQNVSQANVNYQNSAMAVAEGESTAEAFQQTFQRNENQQVGMANATNIFGGDVDEADQVARAEVKQTQDLEQINENEQGSAVAIAIGENSTATAIQVSEQTNVNIQFGSAEAVNVLASMSGMNMAIAGSTDGNDAVDYEQTTFEETNDSPIETEGEDDEEHENKKKKKKEEAQRAESNVTQFQNVDQLNVNVQNQAMAVASNDSHALASQTSYQENFNAQVGYADAMNVYGEDVDYEGAVQVDRMTVTLTGEESEDNPHASIAYDGDSDGHNDVQQEATAVVAQEQLASQANVNDQNMAMAVSENGSTVTATQVTMQSNENIQYASAEATNELGIEVTVSDPYDAEIETSSA